MIRTKARCSDCGWTSVHSSWSAADVALSAHLDGHPDADLPVGGRIQSRTLLDRLKGWFR